MDDENKYINKARDYAKDFPGSTVYDFLNQCDYYKKCSKYSKRHFVSKIIQFFDGDDDIDSVCLHEEAKD